jgi:hypothetical protein
MPTQILAPATSAGNSTDVTVTAAAPVTVGLYTAAGGSVSGEITAPITRKNPSGTYAPIGESLSGARPNLTITGPGVYRVEKPATSIAVGVQSD